LDKLSWLAMVLNQAGTITDKILVAEARRPTAPGRGEVCLEVSACGVCRTDLQIADGSLKARHLPIVPGHQIIGRVSAIGSEVKDVRLGDRLGVGWLASACGICDQCKGGRENLCREARFTGWDCDGGYATYVIAKASYTFPIPNLFSDLDAAPLLCGGVIGYRAMKRSGIKPGEKLGLFGFGASALISIQIAIYWGCRVFVFSRSEEEKKRALILGAEWVGGYNDKPPEPLNAAVTFAPVGEVVIAALQACDRGATIAINAIHLNHVPEFSYDDLWWERSLVSVSNYTRADAKEFLALAAAIPVRTTFEVFELKNSNQALLKLASGGLVGAAVLKIKSLNF
jgi:propanol-preferring alcohol dehydrogenase